MAKALTILFAFLFLFGLNGRTTHIIGGEMYYQCLGNETYQVTLKIYRDCSANNTNNTQFDANANVGIYEANSGAYVQTIFLPFPGANTVPVTASNPCMQSPPSLCVEEAIYTGTLILPDLAGGYDIVYQRCCRNPSTTNITASQTYGITLTAHVPEPQLATCNSSPSFTNYPPLVLCVGENIYFDHSATDADGDVLVYEICTPFTGGSQINPAPNPPLPPPFSLVPWGVGYTINDQLGTTSTLNIDANTGLLTGTPMTQGMFVVGICVKEYRNGVLIGTSTRDFQFTVTQCTSNVVASLPDQTQFCTGYNINFQNNCLNAITYDWDFGDPTTTTDSSDLFAPSYTYPDSGLYTVTLIANPGWPCADTSYNTFQVSPPLVANLPLFPPQCITSNSFDFLANGNFSSQADLSWNFGFNATPTLSNQTEPNGVVYADTGHHVVTVTVSDFGCETTIVDTISIYPEPVPEFSYPAELACVPYTVQFSDVSFSWGGLEYFWEFGDGGTSTDQNPVYTYDQTGIFDVSLTIHSDTGCVVTKTFELQDLITVYPSPTAAISVTPLETSIFTPLVTVTDQSFDSELHEIHMGDGFFTEDRYVEHMYTDTGYFEVMQVVVNDLGCTDTAIVTIYIRPEYTMYVPNTFTPNGDGKNDIFMPMVDGITEYEFTIYNRWGQAIFHTDDHKRGWDGTINNDPSPIDTYVYQIKLMDVNNKFHMATGHVNLVR